MNFGKTKSRRRQAARKHTLKIHKCPICGKEIRGNGFWNHLKACSIKELELTRKFLVRVRMRMQEMEKSTGNKWKDVSDAYELQDTGRILRVLYKTDKQRKAKLKAQLVNVINAM